MKKIIILILLILIVGCQNTQEIENLKIQLTEKEGQIEELNKEIETSNKFNEYYNKAIENYYLAYQYGLTAGYNYNSFSFNWDNGLLEGANSSKVPIGLTDNVLLIQGKAKDEPIEWDDVEFHKSDPLLALWQKQKQENKLLPL